MVRALFKRVESCSFVKKETYLEVVLLSKTLVRRTSSCNNGINGVITRITLSVVNIQLTVRRIYSKYC